MEVDAVERFSADDPVHITSPSAAFRQNPFSASVDQSAQQQQSNTDAANTVAYDDIAELPPEDEPPEPVIPTSRPTCSVMFSSFEQALTIVGGFGRYQIMLLAVVLLATVEFAGNNVVLSLSVYQPQAECHYVDSAGYNTSMTLNDTNRAEFCPIFDSGNCTSMTWTSKFESTVFRTIIEEWGLICNLDHVPDLINSVSLAAPLAITVIAGALSDRFGRRFMLLVCLVGLLLSNAANASVNSWQLYMITRCGSWAFTYCSVAAMFIWTMEKTGQGSQLITNFVSTWHFGYIGAGVLAYWVQSWRSYVIALTLLVVPIIGFFSWFVESPSWLIQTGDMEKAGVALSHMSAVNRGIQKAPLISEINLRPIRRARRESLSELHLQEITFSQRATRLLEQLFDFLASKRNLLYLLLLASVTIAVSSSTNAYNFQLSHFRIEPHFMVIIFGALRLIFNPLVVALDHYWVAFGRRHLVCVTLFTTSALFGTALMMERFWPNDPEKPELAMWRTYALMLFAAVVCGFMWMAIGQYTIELFPTVHRNRISAMLSMCDQLVTIVIPQIVYYEKYWPPLLLFYCVIVTASTFFVMLLMIPETKGRPVPDEDTEPGFVDDKLLHLRCDIGAINWPWQQTDVDELLENMEHNE